MKVLITSGGGAKGAFSVGALQTIQANTASPFDFISGTSTGSLIAALMAGNQLQTLVDVYRNTTNADILTTQNIINNLTSGRPFLFDTGPLEQQINTHVTAAVFDRIRQSAATLCLNAVSLQTGKITVFTTKNILANLHLYDIVQIDSLDLMKKALLGSSNQAVFLPPVKIGTTQYVDGGNREVIPSKIVVNNLNPNENHEIYVLSNNPHELVTVNEIFTDLIKVLFRAIVLFIQEGRENDLDTLANFKSQAPSNIKIKIFYIHPPGELDREFPTGLRFDPLLMQFWMQTGRDTAEQILRDFPDGNFRLPF